MSGRFLLCEDGEKVLEAIDKHLLRIDDSELLKEGQALQPVSLVILDINMPVIDGLKATALIKEKFSKLNDSID